MENGIVVSYKKSGEVLAAQMRRIRSEYDIAESVSMTYAGRLDPAAEGLMMYLVGDERHKKDEYLKKEKEYQFSVLCGIQTDTADLLGCVIDARKVSQQEIILLANNIKKTIMGIHRLPIPSYSGYKVEGMALWTFAREGKKTPAIIKRMEVYSCIVNDPKPVFFTEIVKKVENLFDITEGDFRKDHCLQSWRVLEEKAKEPLYLISCTVHVSSGTYIRSLIEFLSKKYQIPLCAFHITRIKIRDL